MIGFDIAAAVVGYVFIGLSVLFSIAVVIDLIRTRSKKRKAELNELRGRLDKTSAFADSQIDELWSVIAELEERINRMEDLAREDGTKKTDVLMGDIPGKENAYV